MKRVCCRSIQKWLGVPLVIISTTSHQSSKYHSPRSFIHSKWPRAACTLLLSKDKKVGRRKEEVAGGIEDPWKFEGSINLLKASRNRWHNQGCLGNYSTKSRANGDAQGRKEWCKGSRSQLKKTATLRQWGWAPRPVGCRGRMCFGDHCLGRSSGVLTKASWTSCCVWTNLENSLDNFLSKEKFFSQGVQKP